MAVFMIVWAVFSGLFLVVGVIGFSINKFDYYGDEDTAAVFSIVAGAGLIWPIVIPLLVVGLIAYMAVYTLVHFEVIKPPKWWIE